MEIKSVPEFYRNNKSLISKPKWMKNEYKNGIMMQAKAVCLKLEYRVLNTEVRKFFKLCNIETETLKHLISCNKLK